MYDNPAFMVTHVKVKDEKKWDEYRSQVPATLSEWGAEVVFRGKRAEVLTGEHEYTHTIITRFPDAATIRSWYEAPPYQALIPMRDQVVKMALIGYEPFDQDFASLGCAASRDSGGLTHADSSDSSAMYLGL